MGLSETYEKSSDCFKISPTCTSSFNIDRFKKMAEIATTTPPFIVNNYSSERLSTTGTSLGKVTILGKTDIPVPLPSSQNNSTQGSGITTPSEVSGSYISNYIN